MTQLTREFDVYVIGTGSAADRHKALDFGATEFADLDNDTRKTSAASTWFSTSSAGTSRSDPRA
ncbi:hypothetical protein [Streptomyces sp. S.PNR 29]|uniref:hypothetical protein n=1 Tax=Streptomyces sp. S.PNR 29 TaxID=2973805 RepID=UPI0025AF6B21|nr:hypothetical protein [Streptomyces sp. S.PNR 29]MDN0199966.1 hypothetical protein [Streptomyces sp. S.PNR 29]